MYANSLGIQVKAFQKDCRLKVQKPFESEISVAVSNESGELLNDTHPTHGDGDELGVSF